MTFQTQVEGNWIECIKKDESIIDICILLVCEPAGVTIGLQWNHSIMNLSNNKTADRRNSSEVHQKKCEDGE